MTETPHVGITLLESSQAQKEVTVNEALYRIDALLNAGVIDRDLATPPGSPAPGDVYIVAASPTGAWTGKAGQIAYYDQIWRFVVPNEGLMLWLNDENKHVVHNGTSWQTVVFLADMQSSIYDAAGIAQQVVGTTATQTLTNKTLTAPTINAGTLNATTLSSPTINSATMTGGSLSAPTLASPTISGNPVGVVSQMCEGRLTLTSNTPVPTSDVTAATTVYFTPYGGNQVALYNGSDWVLYAFSQLSVTVPATTNTMYDVFIYNNSGTLTLEAVAWTTDTTRATALATQHGIYVKTGATGRRYLGSFRTTGTSGQTEDSKAKRYVWNYYNRLSRLMSVIESTATWTYSTNSWQQANANSANQLDFVIGVAEDMVSATLVVQAKNSTATVRVIYAGIGVDTTASATGRYGILQANSTNYQSIHAFYDDVPGIGRHYLAWMEQGAGTDTQTWLGTNRYGLFGRVMG